MWEFFEGVATTLNRADLHHLTFTSFFPFFFLNNENNRKNEPCVDPDQFFSSGSSGAASIQLQLQQIFDFRQLSQLLAETGVLLALCFQLLFTG